MHGLKGDVGRILGFLLLAKAIVFYSSYEASRGGNFLYLMSTRWDSQLLEQIAQSGYPQNHQAGLYAFSPFYPTIVSLLHYATGSYWVAAFVLTNVLSFLFPLLMLKFSNPKAALMISIFPTYALFGTVPYSDSLTLIFLLLSFIFLINKRNLLAGICLGLAIFNAYNLAYTIPAFIVYILVERRTHSSVNIKMRNLLVFLIPLIVVGAGILAFYQIETGNMFSYFVLESTYWGATIVTPVAQAAWILNTNGQGWFTNQGWTVLSVRIYPIYWLVRNVIFEAFYAIGAACILKSNSIGHSSPNGIATSSGNIVEDPDIRLLFFIFSALVLVPLLFIGGTPSVSIPRLLLPAFPIFFAYSTRIGKGNWFVVYVVLSLAVTSWATYSFMEAFFA